MHNTGLFAVFGMCAFSDQLCVLGLREASLERHKWRKLAVGASSGGGQRADLFVKETSGV